MRALLLAAALCALAAAGCGSDTGDEAVPAPATPIETTDADASSRPAAPAIEGVSLDGERLSLAGFAGRPVFVNVWSSW